ncbi:nicotinamide-nucleotide amidase [Halorientalis persicus]|jgi:nicotinamide-nucleotide amidase|uniref:Nicotinamide-nucleotide amidase n=1 Tax=Halorientalis persicus TaxID=1367881 RepID=A0A1H8F6F8_9EURY|nr:CinA family protein [Halorientalis persicus]SEN27403.1 nicotinamide-nucleotide amidase [Halorientalis persicus]
MHGFGEEPLIETQVGEALAERGETLAAAESCSGGLVASLVTDVPGSSEYFDRSYVTYSYDAKREVLGVSREALDAEGAVSERVGREMAKAARDTADATWGVSTTGVAGPERDRADHPIGTVFVGVAYAGPWGSGESTTTVERYQFDGSRTEIKERVARQALADLLDRVQA